MVRRWLCLALSLALPAPLLAEGILADVSLTAQPLSGTAQPLSPAASAELQDLAARPPEIPRIPNRPVDDFFAVTLISMPFTAFWALIGALAAGGISQKRFPPEFDTPLLAGAGIAAASASVAIGLVSVSWKNVKMPGQSGTPAPTPVAVPSPQP
jgi:hypothetical protein